MSKEGMSEDGVEVGSRGWFRRALLPCGGKQNVPIFDP